MSVSEGNALHGGRLRQAAQQYGIAEADWLDLSTGINPQGWPVPAVPAEVWQRLPEQEDGLMQAAHRYYGCASLLPLAGSQAAISLLPRLMSPTEVLVPSPGYSEHARAWDGAAHRLHWRGADQALAPLPDQVAVQVIIHPNNPGGQRYPLEALLARAEQLADRGGWLVVDEAFMDTTPEQSLLSHCPKPGLIVLRSLGKFFGLAGIRMGFVAAQPVVLDSLSRRLGPWAVSHPARWVATQALLDVGWQQYNRTRVLLAGERLKGLLEKVFAKPVTGSALFQTVWLGDQAPVVHEALARHGILTRLLDQQDGVRFGLPRESDWFRLEEVLE